MSRLRRGDAERLVEKHAKQLDDEAAQLSADAIREMPNEELTERIRLYDLHDDPDVEVNGATSEDDGR